MADNYGLIQIYTGDGKGKTTAAIGLAVRAAGRGLACRIIQFMKGESTSGEVEALAAVPAIKIDRIGLNLIGPKPPSPEEVKASLAEAMAVAAAALSGPYDLVVLDEIVTAVSLGLVEESSLLALLDARARRCEVVLTGRGASGALIARADLVTEMRPIKHPYDRGQRARLGIEY